MIEQGVQGVIALSGLHRGSAPVAASTSFYSVGGPVSSRSGLRDIVGGQMAARWKRENKVPNGQRRGLSTAQRRAVEEVDSSPTRSQAVSMDPGSGLPNTRVMESSGACEDAKLPARQLHPIASVSGVFHPEAHHPGIANLICQPLRIDIPHAIGSCGQWVRQVIGSWVKHITDMPRAFKANVLKSGRVVSGIYNSDVDVGDELFVSGVLQSETYSPTFPRNGPKQRGCSYNAGIGAYSKCNPVRDFHAAIIPQEKLAPRPVLLNMAPVEDNVPQLAGTPSMAPGCHYSALSRILLNLQQAVMVVSIPASLKLLRRVSRAYGQRQQNHSTAKRQQFIQFDAEVISCG